MATYVAERDTYAGWHGFGKPAAWCAGGAGVVAFLCWAALHGGFGELRQASDQLFLSAVLWTSAGLGLLMAFCVFGSLSLSAKSRGTVVVDDVGVRREIGRRARMLRWEEIEGFILNPGGGITLIPRQGPRRIKIPRFLDDYRACIAEIKAQGIPVLPLKHLRRKQTWGQRLRVYCAIVAYGYLNDARMSHRVRIVSAITCIALLGWMLTDDTSLEDGPGARWGAAAILLAMFAWAGMHMAHTW